MAEERRFGILRVSTTLLINLLCLPGDTTFYELGDLLQVRRADVFEFLVSHKDLPNCPVGRCPPRLYPSHEVTVTDDPGYEVEFVDWGAILED